MKVLLVLTLMVASTCAATTLNSCTDVDAVLAVALTSNCLTKFDPLTQPGSNVIHCKAFWDGIKCLAPLVYPDNPDACLAAMKDAMPMIKDKIFQVMSASGATLNDPNFDPTKCDQNQASDSVPCKDGAAIMDMAVNDPAAGACILKFNALTEQGTEAEHCKDFWDGIACLSRIVDPADPEACLKAMTEVMPQFKDQIFSLLSTLGLTMADPNFDPMTCEWKSGPGPKDDKHEQRDFKVDPGAEKCFEPATLLAALEGCMPQAVTSVTNEHCKMFEETVQCIARKLYPAADKGNERSKCETYILDFFIRHKDQMPDGLEQLSNFDFKKCKERESACKDGSDPLDGVECGAGKSCEKNYECVHGVCCAKVTTGMCPPVRGSSICKNTCDIDSECAEDEKCCDQNCFGKKTCTKLVDEELSECEEEFREAATDLFVNGLCGDGHSHTELPRCLNEKFAPQQGGANGWNYCVDEDGNKLGTDFTGNVDCTKVHTGRCQAASCQPQVDNCADDSKCGKEEKCCVTKSSDGTCIRACVQALKVDPTVAETDECAERSCCRQDLCFNKRCPAHPSAVCHINSCGGCKAEFSNKNGEKVDCFQGVSKCMREQEEGRQMNADRKPESEKVKQFIEQRWSGSSSTGGSSTGGSSTTSGDMGGGGMDHNGETGGDSNDDSKRDEYGEKRPDAGKLQEDQSRQPIRDSEDDDDDKAGTRRCFLDKAVGPCDNAGDNVVSSWYYNHEMAVCEAFDYGGCDGNANRFTSRVACVSACEDIGTRRCFLDKEAGSCEAAMRRWYYDQWDGYCKEFYYGGCEGNANRFMSLEACNNACADRDPMCPAGEPLFDMTKGHNYNCGLGGTACPKDYTCRIHPADEFAVCCKKEPLCMHGDPLKDTMGGNLFCGRGGERCPEDYSCRIEPADKFAVCCKKSVPTSVCDMLDQYDVCQNGGKCDIGGDETTHWHVCSCADGYYGLFCENQIPQPGPCPGAEANCETNPCDSAACPLVSNVECEVSYCGGCHALWKIKGTSTYVTEKCYDTPCWRDLGKLTTVWYLLGQENDGGKLVHSLLTLFRPPNHILPVITCDTNGGYTTKQSGYFMPYVKEQGAVLYCVDAVTGVRILNTDIRWADAGQEIDCAQKTQVDILSLPRRCSAPILGCDDTPGTGQSCIGQWYYDNNNQKCVQALSGWGFDSITACYDECQYRYSPNEPQGQCPVLAAGMMGTCDEACNDCEFGGQLCCSNNCGHLCKDPVYPIVEPVPCEGQDCVYEDQYCDVTVVYNGDNTGECITFQQHCLMEPDSGTGERYVGAYYFNAVKRECETFYYTGLGGSGNRFYSISQCHAECGLKKYKFGDIVCPRPQFLLYHNDMKVMDDMCASDYDCPGDEVCCSNDHATLCTMPIRACSTGYRCSFYGWCDANDKCVCPDCTDVAVSPVCGSDMKRHDSECAMQQHACRVGKYIKNINDGECTEPDPIDPTLCEAAACMTLYDPICVYDRTTNVGILTTFGNMCEYSRKLKCNSLKEDQMPILYRGECKDRSCGDSTCQVYEMCSEGVCGCPDACDTQYLPLCAHDIDADDDEAKTFSNECQMLVHACKEKVIFMVKHKGACKADIEEDKYECPAMRADVPNSAESTCDPATNDHCDAEGEKCCPYGSGFRCVLKRDLTPKTTVKPGICPIQSALTFNSNLCGSSVCEYDADCDGDARCCDNDACGYGSKTCAQPIDTSQLCGAGESVVPGVTCTLRKPASCPGSSTCKNVEATVRNVMVDVCCLPDTDTLTKEEIKTTITCNAFAAIGLACENGGTCIANLWEAKMCECPNGFFGVFCQNDRPDLRPDGSCRDNNVNCLRNPCDGIEKCPLYPNAKCTSSYCGGCHAIWTDYGVDVSVKCHDSHCLRQRYLSNRVASRVGRGQTDDSELCDNGKKPTYCFRSPCDGIETCPGHPDATCTEDYCVGCDAIWMLNGVNVTASCPVSTRRKRDSHGDGEDSEGGTTLTSHSGTPDSTTTGGPSMCITEDPNVNTLLHALKMMGVWEVFHEVACDANGDFEPRQCLMSLDDCRSTRCRCTDRDGMMHGSTMGDRNQLRCDVINTDTPRFCLEKPDNSAVCGERSTRFYFDVAQSDCVEFTDGGCDTKQNNFEDKDTCLSSCISPDLTKAECNKKHCPAEKICRYRNGQAECVDKKQPEASGGHFEPRCGDNDEYELRQCHRDFCVCVLPDTGDVVPVSADVGGHLKCTRDAAGNVMPDFGDGERVPPPACEDGTEARFCKNGGNPCQDCEMTHTGPGGQTGGDNDDHAMCDCESCPSNEAPKKCSVKCTANSCQRFPEATCRVDRCTCQKVYTDAAGNVVDCTKVHSQCARSKSANNKEKKAMEAAGVDTNTPASITCNENSGYERECQDNTCWCLHATTGVRDGDGASPDDLNCAATQRKSAVKQAKLKLKLSSKKLADFSNTKLEQIKQRLIERFEEFTELKVKFITLYDGSLMADVTVEGTSTETDINSNVLAWEAEVASGNVDLVITGETLTPTTTTTELLTAEDLGTEPTPTDDDDNTTMIIIVVVVCVAVLIVIVVALICYKSGQRRKESDIHFDDLHGQTNPTYKH